eukprot:3769120-Alexandrium_andersonii.AAC.1
MGAPARGRRPRAVVAAAPGSTAALAAAAGGLVPPKCQHQPVQGAAHVGPVLGSGLPPDWCVDYGLRPGGP